MSMDIERIQEILPHRFPFLLVDKVVRYDEKSLTAIKNVTVNEPFFQGHFPTRKVMPGVLIVEAMAQACGLLSGSQMGDELKPDTIYYLVAIDNTRFRRVVVPGDQLTLEVVQMREIRGLIKYSCKASVDGEVAASADLMVSRSA
jgi:3-hydroxyacyl-[acyl-carrier-protein] dehydratase